jgi:hypothetical protein
VSGGNGKNPARRTVVLVFGREMETDLVSISGSLIRKVMSCVASKV